ncbi:MAG: alkaline phosphatase family protein [Candidatus Promineifilaceae bacterium]|nr:alkaline phosphatase family protein [Candidatus Promineifilaceae bacterium]
MALRKTVVIGMDGAPFELIGKWSASGQLPNLAKLIDKGSFSILRSTIPVHSPTAWTSFITGLNPGEHGVFDFVRRDKDSYQLRVIRADQFKGTSLWRLLSEHDRAVGVMNVPMTYPPEPVNGFLLSGLGTPDFVPYSYPPQLSDELNRGGYRVNKKFFFDLERQDEWLDDIHAITEIRGETAVQLMQEKPWDFFMVVFRNSDEICHFFWHHMDETHPAHDPQAPERYKTAILDLYRHIDQWVGRIVEAAGEDCNVVIMSDHGAGPLYKDVFLNEWLIQQGWLKLKEESISQHNWLKLVRRLGLTRENISNTLTKLNLHRVEVMIKRALGDRIHILPRDERPEFLNSIDWSSTKAYSFGYYGQIFINLKGREPQGIVQPGAAYETLRQEIATELQKLVDPEDGLPVVDSVHKREDLYHGGYIAEAPDLLAIMRNFTYMTRKGYEFAARRGELFRTPYTMETGSHRLEGILIAAGPDFARQLHLEASEIQDLTPTLLYLQECPIPRYMDGRLITDLFTPGFLNRHEPQYEERDLTGRDEYAMGWSAKEEAEITERLKKLGYLG